MSTAYSSAKQQYIGNGVTTEWGFDFPIKKHSELKVYLKRSGLSQVLLEEGVDYSFVTENTIAFPIKTGEAKLQAADVLALQRESVFESEYNFSNQQRLEPEEVMHADDNLERQIQELKRDVSQAIRIQPTSNINTDEYFIAVESIYENLDNITNVSGISAEIVNCSDNISDISTVSSDIANVNAVGQSISDVNTVASNVASVNTVGNNISSVNTAASNMAAIHAAPTAASNAATSANNSHIWAEGTDAQVRALGGVHSAKGWAEQSTNANIALTNTPYTTNRILKIPQDIKLELNNGTLTLKAGSKVYVPNGFEADGTTPKFDVITTTKDLTYTEPTSSKSTNPLFVSSNGNSLFRRGNNNSGTTVPDNYIGAFYNLTTNKMESYIGGSLSDTMSLPICVCTSNGQSTNNISFIDQVFNGFGYIGSTVFVLPGVKVQIPNGINEDGTYRVIPYITQNVIVKEVTGTGVKDVLIYSNGVLSWADGGVYLAEDGYVRNKTNGTIRYGAVTVQVFITTAGKIDSFVPRNVDSVVNSNASNFSQAGRSYLSGLGMPSGRYIDLTLGASGSTYTAPANGWFVLQCKVTGNNKYFATRCSGSDYGFVIPVYTGGGNIPVRTTIPCLKGGTYIVSYNVTINSTERFRFIYAEGEN